MTVWGFLAVLAAGLACWRVGTALSGVLGTLGDRSLTVRERLASVEERKITLEELSRKPRAKAQPMPVDLRNRIAVFEDDWAREDEERTIMALYAEYDDWDTVRKNLRPLPSAQGTDQIFAPKPEFIR